MRVVLCGIHNGVGLRRKGTGAALGSEQHRRRVLLRPLPFARSFPRTAERGSAVADQRHGAPHGEGFLEAITEAMVAIHERYHGRKPGNAHTILMGDDMVACMLGDVYTDVEKTMIELQRQALVHETRSAFQKAMEHRFIAAVERLTGRAVAQFLSTHHVGPDLELELFFLEPRPTAPSPETW